MRDTEVTTVSYLGGTEMVGSKKHLRLCLPLNNV